MCKVKCGRGVNKSIDAMGDLSLAFEDAEDLNRIASCGSGKGDAHWPIKKVLLNKRGVSLNIVQNRENRIIVFKV